MASSSYPYRPLDLPRETRVLTVQPGKFADDVICSLSHMTLASSDEPYEALSYCWSKGLDRDPGISPDTEIPWAVYGHDENGEKVEKSGKTPWRDLADHPFGGEIYIRLGGRMPDAPIICDGVKLVVGGELFRALKRLRTEDGPPLRIWVDALCINQDDLWERNEHVKIMGQVYAGAARTRVWLGEATQTDYQAMQTLVAIGQVFEDLFVKRGMLSNGATMQEVQWHFMNTRNVDRLDWGLLSEMLNRAWFRRTWIIQEVAKSKDIMVHIGDMELQWKLVAGIISLIMEYKLQSSMNECKAIKTIPMLEALRVELVENCEMHTKMPLLTLLEELRDFQATIPSDKIYGILGLTSNKDEFVVDYSQSPEKVFTDFAARQLNSGCLDVLTHCVESSKPTTLKLPSWVPDWTRPGWTEPLRIRGFKAAAAGDTKPELVIDEVEGILRIKGRILDKVAAIETKRPIPSPSQQGPMDADVDDGKEKDEFAMNEFGGPIFDAEHDELDDADEGISEPTESSSKNETGKDASEKPQRDAKFRQRNHLKKMAQMTKEWHLSLVDVAFPDKKATPRTWENLWRTLMCNQTRDGEKPGENGATGMDIYYKVVMNMGGLQQTLQERVDHQIASHGLSPRDADAYYLKEKEAFETFVGAHSKWCYNRRFFRSEDGQFGWGVEGMRAGDAVVLFHGCDSVLVVRDVGEGRWKMIGDCYIHGLMDGEGLAGEFEEVELRII